MGRYAQAKRRGSTTAPALLAAPVLHGEFLAEFSFSITWDPPSIATPDGIVFEFASDLGGPWSVADNRGIDEQPYEWDAGAPGLWYMRAIWTLGGDPISDYSTPITLNVP